ncbi:hypothetical protein [Streptomyces coeruleorubidus]|uniref:hypothetical protein n=1 Tax=Streptomyces coeruleorubidus TaxID=116188 RepID=UPI0036804488
MLDVRLAARSDRFDEDDDRWETQVLLLHQEIEEAVGPLDRRSHHTPGTKGVVWEVIVPLTPVVVPGVVAALTVWLKRDQGRSVHLTWTVDGRSGEFNASGDALDTDTLRTALEHGLRAATGDSTTAEEAAGQSGTAGVDDRDGAPGA